MEITQKTWKEDIGWETIKGDSDMDVADLVLVFSDRATLQDTKMIEEINQNYKCDNIVFSSTAGNIVKDMNFDKGLTLTAFKFEKSSVTAAVGNKDDDADFDQVVLNTLKKIKTEGLVHLMVFADGLLINGADVSRVLLANVPSSVAVTGGMTSDGFDFKEVFTGLNNKVGNGNLVLVGFYGEDLLISYGSFGGWDAFGPERIITKSKGNILYEFDGEEALTVYKKYLGDKAKGLPQSGLYFPIALRLKGDTGDNKEMVRTMMTINEKDNSLLFAGDVPEGATARLMIANFEHLIEGASQAAGLGIDLFKDEKPDFAILISCMGRKNVLKDRTDEEIEAVRNVFGEDVLFTGFYSYGEIAPLLPTDKNCRLHNQTMTITVFKEK